jgi:BirA family biotin operon repressor/biotin-[acetyl-CoA-carboxylase] ligase
MPANLATTISQDWVDISIISGTRPKRNHIAGLVIDELLTMLKAYQQQGLVPFIHQWQKFDCWHGKEVILTSTKQRITGRSLGINQQGALKLATQQGVVTINSGTASLRLA